MANVVNEIKNWHLFTDVFGDEYEMHDAVIKRFDLDGDDLSLIRCIRLRMTRCMI